MKSPPGLSESSKKDNSSADLAPFIRNHLDSLCQLILSEVVSLLAIQLVKKNKATRMAKVGNLERMQEEQEEEETEDDLPFQMDTDVTPRGSGDVTSDVSLRRPSLAAVQQPAIATAEVADFRRSQSALRSGSFSRSSGGGVARSGGGFSDESGHFFRGRSLTVDSSSVSGVAAPLGISRSRR